MKKHYEKPEAEILEFAVSDNVTTSTREKTDQNTSDWWTCETRYVDVFNIEGTVCGYVDDT